MNCKDKNVTIMGLGRFGGGLGVTKWFLEQGANVLLTDLASKEDLREELRELGEHPNLTLILGEHRKEDFSTADVVIANPAVPKPWENEYLKTAWEHNIEVTTEIALVVHELDRNQVVGVTGTAGKSTTVAMLHEALLGSEIAAHIGGNIGGSLLSSLQQIKQSDVVIIELSSAMLWWLDKVGEWAPRVAVLTTVEENHIDWHGTFEEYCRCKRCLFEHQHCEDVSITQDPTSSFSGLTVLGAHNERNAAVAFLAAVEMGANVESARKAIQAFKGLPHRLQTVVSGYYNDSKSTTPTATALAIDAFQDASKVHVIVGGYDKKLDLSLLADQSLRVAKMYAIGDTAKTICALAKGNVQDCGTLAVAVYEAMRTMREGDVLVLSPGCASWDQFDNYEQRGEEFIALVNTASHQQVQ